VFRGSKREYDLLPYHYAERRTTSENAVFGAPLPLDALAEVNRDQLGVLSVCSSAGDQRQVSRPASKVHDILIDLPTASSGCSNRAAVSSTTIGAHDAPL
jgi:hypothetical protein